MTEIDLKANTSAPANPRLDPQKAVNEPHSARRVNKIAEYIDAKSYLEIGVFKGKTFNRLNFPIKVGVDPFFNFAVEDFRAEGTSFIAKKSDDFFAERELDQSFDIVFLDGLHTFQQTLRDFCNSMMCANKKTVWLIDDVFPSDVYSSLPISSEARGFRKKAGGNSAAWQGDVYKMLFFINDFMPALDYLTINTRGNAQAVVWQRPQVDRKIALGTLEQIERLDYFSLLKLASFCKFTPEELAFKRLGEVLPT